MDKEQLRKLSEPTVDVYMSIEEEILVNIAKRLRKHNGLLDEDIGRWEYVALNELQNLRKDNLDFLMKQSGETEATIRKALEEAGFGELLQHEDDLQAGVAAGTLSEAPPMKESGALLAILQAYEDNALQKFNLINTTMLDQSQKIYLDIINETTGQVLAGTKTPREAVRDTARKWAENGVPALIDRSGRKWTTEAYTSMIARSVSNDVANEMQDARMEEYGVKLVEVSSYAGARPKCADDQGKIYSIRGTHDKHPPLSSTSYGEPDGLFGVNCSHSKYPFVEGISERTFKPVDPNRNKRIYENSQKQRYLERQIKHAKREVRMMEALGDDVALQAAKRKVRDKQANMRTFINKTNRTRRYDREQVY